MGDIRICIDNIRIEMSCVKIDVPIFKLVVSKLTCRHPNWWRESDSNRRSSGYEPAAGTTPVNPALSHETIVKPCQVLQLPRKSRHQHKRIPRKSVTPFSRLFSPWPVPDDGRSARSRARRQTPVQLPPRCALRPYRPRRSPACGQSNASRPRRVHVTGFGSRPPRAPPQSPA